MHSKLFSNIFALLPLLLIFSFNNNQAYANSDSDIAFIISAKKPPNGVIFEVIADVESDLKPALEQIDIYIKQLKIALPNIKLAIVTHGKEEFALLTENKVRFKASHQKVQSLVNNNIPVHVCGTHASWYNYSERDFPDYVDVAVSGPKKVIEYQRKGYALINIRNGN